MKTPFTSENGHETASVLQHSFYVLFYRQSSFVTDLV
jgi:hypothetical protein